MTASALSPNRILSTAVDYGRRGWPVFPCDPATKKPLTAHGHNDASIDEDQIIDWWTQFPDAMIGVPMGPDSGVFAIDVDVSDQPGKPDGMAAWRELVTAHRTPINTRTHKTPSGGEHLLFRWDPDRPVTNRRGRLPPGIDVRGAGGYIIVPPSCRADGELYRIADSLDHFQFTEAPDWLHEILEDASKVNVANGNLCEFQRRLNDCGPMPMLIRHSGMNARKSHAPCPARATKL